MDQITTLKGEFIAGIKANLEPVLKQFYHTNFGKVKYYILKNNGSQEQVKDIYQEAFIVVWQNIKDKKFIPESESAANGYLYTVAKNKWMDYLRSNEYKKKRPLNDTRQMEDLGPEISDLKFDDENEKKLKKVIEIFETLGKPCKKLLTIFYFDKKPLREIAKELNLAEASARNKKYRCMERLRAMVLLETK